MDADRLVTGLVREILFRRGFADVLSTFDAETVRASRPRFRPNAPGRAGPARTVSAKLVLAPQRTPPRRAGAHRWAPTPHTHTKENAHTGALRRARPATPQCW